MSYLKFDIKHQDSYSRGELLLRTFLGVFYILIPHFFILFFLQLGAAVLQVIAWFAVLFTGEYPRSFFDYQVKVMRWNLRVTARIFNMSDGYPAFGLDAEDKNVTLEVEYPEKLSRLMTFIKPFLGWILVLPHLLLMYIYMIGLYFVFIISWLAILFTGKYPKGMFDYMVNVQRFMYKVNLYLMFMTDDYPPFSGKEEK